MENFPPDTRPPVARWGTRIEDLADGLRGTVLGHYGMAFSAVMDDDTVRYFGKSVPRFRLVRDQPECHPHSGPRSRYT